MPCAPGVARGAARRSPIAALLLTALAVLAATFLVAAPMAAAKKTLPGGVSARSGLEAEIPESTETEVTETGETGTEYEPVSPGKAALIELKTDTDLITTRTTTLMITGS